MRLIEIFKQDGKVFVQCTNNPLKNFHQAPILLAELFPSGVPRLILPEFLNKEDIKEIIKSSSIIKNGIQINFMDNDARGSYFRATEWVDKQIIKGDYISDDIFNWIQRQMDLTFQNLGLPENELISIELDINEVPILLL